MDGIDGLVGGSMIFVILSSSIILKYNFLGLISALLAFLYWNWSPSKIFMGDAGSTFLGGFLVTVITQASSLEESAIIARGKISSLDELDYNQISSLVITGGFGAAKNLSSWAFEGENSTVIKKVKKLIVHCIDNKKPILSLCISPVLISKTLEKTEYNPKLSLGSKNSKSDYNIIDMHKTLSNLGVETHDCSIEEICID